MERINKGQKIDLTKYRRDLRYVRVGMGWQGAGGPEVDTAVFLLGADGRAACDEDFVFYGNPRHKTGAVVHRADPAGGDRQEVEVDLAAVPAAVQKLAFTATIYEAETRRQSFGQVAGMYIRLVDAADGTELLRYETGGGFSVETAIVVGELYRYKGVWKFSAVGAGFSGGLAALCGNFGIEVTRSRADASAPHADTAASGSAAPSTPAAGTAAQGGAEEGAEGQPRQGRWSARRDLHQPQLEPASEEQEERRLPLLPLRRLGRHRPRSRLSLRAE